MKIEASDAGYLLGSPHAVRLAIPKNWWTERAPPHSSAGRRSPPTGPPGVSIVMEKQSVYNGPHVTHTWHCLNESFVI
jgi:hypothetical protein